MRYLVSTGMIVVALIHLVPSVGVLGEDRLISLYGTAIDDPSLLLLMRHRAVLFAIIGAYMFWAAFNPLHLLPAFVIAATSLISFLLLFGMLEHQNANLQRVFWVDIFAAIVLMISFILWLLERRTQRLL